MAETKDIRYSEVTKGKRIHVHNHNRFYLRKKKYVLFKFKYLKNSYS